MLNNSIGNAGDEVSDYIFKLI